MKYGSNVKNALSIDVEDYFHVAAFSKVIKPSDWDSMDSHVEKNTFNLLELLNTANVRATFFVLGWVAERKKMLIRTIHAQGHEVACHGYSHQLIYTQTPQKFSSETKSAKSLLEDIVGERVKGYRAASYSITKKSLWALDILAECGFEYDSSIFPVHHDNYGIARSPRHPYRIKTESGLVLNEFPLSTLQMIKYNLPVAGGGYFRLFPYFFSKFAFRVINRTHPFIFYLHPWEIDNTQPRISASLLSKFRHYNNIDVCESRLVNLLRDFRFARVDEILRTLDLGQPISTAML